MVAVPGPAAGATFLWKKNSLRSDTFFWQKRYPRPRADEATPKHIIKPRRSN
jgi:hypothetical protein